MDVGGGRAEGKEIEVWELVKNEVVFGCDLAVDVLSGRNFFDVVYLFFCLFAGRVPTACT